MYFYLITSRNLIAIILFPLLLVSCDFQKKQASLTLQDSLVLQIDKPIPHFCPAMFYYEKNGIRYLFVDDKLNKEIRLFNLGAGKEIEPIPVCDTGINSIPHHLGFLVKDLDSIYLPGANQHLFCINRNGKIIKKIDFSALSREYPLLTVACSISRFTKGAVIIGNEIFFLQEDTRKNYFSRKPSDYRFLFKYNVKNDSFGISPISLPDNFWDEGKREMSIFLTYNELQKVFVFGSMYSDKIYLSNDGKKITKTYHSRSKAIQEYFLYSPENNLNSENYFYSLCKYSYNVGLIWDPYNKIYYRFVWPGMKDLSINQRELISQVFNCFPTFTIDILDKDFNTLGSYPLPKNKYNWNNYFLTKDGLFLAENDSTDKKNNTWTFHLFKVRFHS